MASDTNDPILLERVKRLAPGFYTERDGGDWYVLTPDNEPNHDRLGEGFHDRSDARLFLCFLAGEPVQPGWAIERASSWNFARLYGVGDYPATLWVRAIDRRFPGALDRLPKKEG